MDSQMPDPIGWSADSQLVRSRSTDGWNLAIGEPHLLREVMSPYYPRHYPADLSYPDTVPDPDLMTELRKRHPTGHIVVTTGAKQALYAAIWAILQIRIESDRLYHRAPYWPSYPTIAERSGLQFVSTCHELSDRQWERTVKVSTEPNNPDGSSDYTTMTWPTKVPSEPGCDIWDAAYADHDLYGWNGVIPKHKISVWSAGKLLGSPGARVGWLVTEDEYLARLAGQYVEQHTSGVATTSQYHVAATMRNLEGVEHRVKRDFRVQLYSNRALFHGYLEDHIIDRETDFNRGMFAWFEPKNPEQFKAAIDKLKILMVDGSACGAPGCYRASLGLTNSKFHSAVLALVKELEK